MKQLLIATHNPAKKQELQEGFMSLVGNNHRCSLQFLDDLHITNDPEETGKTFEENARLKAKYYGDLSGILTISDDGGIIIPSLNNEPGVNSKRWMGREASDKELIEYTLKRLKGKRGKERVAYFQTCICIYNPLTKKTMCSEEKIHGHIAEKPSNRATDGFPYRALFIVDQYDKYYDELTKKEHHTVNHRLKAVKKLTPFIKKDLLQ